MWNVVRATSKGWEDLPYGRFTLGCHDVVLGCRCIWCAIIIVPFSTVWEGSFVELFVISSLIWCLCPPPTSLPIFMSHIGTVLSDLCPMMYPSYGVPIVKLIYPCLIVRTLNLSSRCLRSFFWRIARSQA